MSRIRWLWMALALTAVIVVALVNRAPVQPVPDPAPDADTGATLAMEGYATIEADRSIVIHCGTSMRPAAERIAYEFQKRHGIAVRFNFGGSSELLAGIELGRQGDLYLCHDPYAYRLEQKGLLARAATVGYLEPVIIVPPGNPRAVASLGDLTGPGLRVGLPDARFATAGKLAEQALRDLNLLEDVRRNVRLESRGHNELALAVMSGQLDAAVAWNFIASYYAGRLEIVAPGVAFPETRVTLCLLNSADDVAAATLFMEFAASQHARGVFEALGYRRQAGAASESPADE